MTDRPKILVSIHLLHGREVPSLARFTDAGYEIVANDRRRSMTEAEMIAALPGVVATVAGSEPYNERVFAAAPDLRVVARLGVGYDQIDVAAATRAGVPIAMAFGTNHEAVADHAFALMTALANRLAAYDATVRGGGWGPTFHPSLHQATVGIVGFGRIGRAFARRCRGFEMRILASDPLVTAAEAQALGAELVPLDDLLAQADFVSLHAPFSPETDRLMDRERFARMKPGALLVNTARGGLIDEDALIEALDSGRLAGAGLDVFRTEPPKDSPLFGRTDVILTPHIAGVSAQSTILMADRCVESILAILDGRDPGPGLVLNPEVLRRA